jgi:hypothetical protein
MKIRKNHFKRFGKVRRFENKGKKFGRFIRNGYGIEILKVYSKWYDVLKNGVKI